MIMNMSKRVIFAFMVLVNTNVMMTAMGFTIAESKNRHHRSLALIVDGNDSIEIDGKDSTARTTKSFAKTAPSPKSIPTKTPTTYAHSKNPSSTSTASPFVMMQMSPGGAASSSFVAYHDDEEVTYSYPTIVASCALSIVLGFAIGYGT